MSPVPPLSAVVPLCPPATPLFHSSLVTVLMFASCFRHVFRRAPPDFFLARRPHSLYTPSELSMHTVGIVLSTHTLRVFLWCRLNCVRAPPEYYFEHPSDLSWRAVPIFLAGRPNFLCATAVRTFPRPSSDLGSRFSMQSPPVGLGAQPRKRDDSGEVQ